MGLERQPSRLAWEFCVRRPGILLLAAILLYKAAEFCGKFNAPLVYLRWEHNQQPVSWEARDCIVLASEGVRHWNLNAPHASVCRFLGA